MRSLLKELFKALPFKSIQRSTLVAHVRNPADFVLLRPPQATLDGAILVRLGKLVNLSPDLHQNVKEKVSLHVAIMLSGFTG